MIYFVRGKLHSILPNKVIIENNGIGYEITIGNSTVSKLPPSGSEVLLYTYYQNKEDNTALFGFMTKEELSMFHLLISVSGIGPKSAVTMLGETSPKDLMVAIITDDIKTMSSFPGIGKKTAARLILELKDKIKTQDAVNEEFGDIAPSSSGAPSDEKSEAVDALTALGYSRSEAFKTVISEWEENMPVETIIKLALKAFAGKNRS